MENNFLLCSFEQTFEKFHCLFSCEHLKIRFQCQISNSRFRFDAAFVCEFQGNLVRKIFIIVFPVFDSFALPFFIIVVDPAVEKLGIRNFYNENFFFVLFFYSTGDFELIPK